MSELLRSVMAECAEMARAGRRAAPFAGCAHGQLGAAMTVAIAPSLPPHRKTAPMVPRLVHDRDNGARLDAVLPIILPPQERRPGVAAARPLATRRAA